MKVTVDFIRLQTTINSTRIRRILRRQPRRLGKLPLRIPACMRQDMPSMRIILLVHQSLHILRIECLILRHTTRRLLIELLIPQLPIRAVLHQQHAGHDMISRGILHVDSEIVAGHFDDHIDVHLQLARYALFDAEVLVFGAAVPVYELAEGEECADCEDDYGPLSAATGCGCEIGFCFG